VPAEGFARLAHPGVAFAAGQAARHELHHHRVGIECCERRPVRRPPVAQQQTLGVQLGHQINLATGSRAGIIERIVMV
jgi:hypothetical protein